MIYSVERSRDARKYFAKADAGFKKLFFRSLETMQRDPTNKNRKLDIKPLKGYVNVYKRRIGGYRVIYKLYDDTLVILIADMDSR